MDKKIDEKQLAALEQERNEALARVVNRVRQSQNAELGVAAHNSHSSAGHRGHRAHSATSPEYRKQVLEGQKLSGAILNKLLAEEDLNAEEVAFVVKLVRKKYAALDEDMQRIKGEPEANRRNLVGLCRLNGLLKEDEGDNLSIDELEELLLSLYQGTT